jgi:hypothetical protein
MGGVANRAETLKISRNYSAGLNPSPLYTNQFVPRSFGYLFFVFLF